MVLRQRLYIYITIVSHFVTSFEHSHCCLLCNQGASILSCLHFFGLSFQIYILFHLKIFLISEKDFDLHYFITDMIDCSSPAELFRSRSLSFAQSSPEIGSLPIVYELKLSRFLSLWTFLIIFSAQVSKTYGEMMQAYIISLSPQNSLMFRRLLWQPLLFHDVKFHLVTCLRCAGSSTSLKMFQSF